MAESRALVKAREQNERQKALIKRLKSKGEDATKTAVRTAAAMGTSFAVSYVEGRYPDKSEILGIPVSLAVGVGLTVTGAMGWAGKESSELVQSAGDGALSAYAARRGYDMGMDAAQG